jgi:hypothetical protein
MQRIFHKHSTACQDGTAQEAPMYNRTCSGLGFPDFHGAIDSNHRTGGDCPALACQIAKNRATTETKEVKVRSLQAST